MPQPQKKNMPFVSVTVSLLTDWGWALLGHVSLSHVMTLVRLQQFFREETCVCRHKSFLRPGCLREYRTRWGWRFLPERAHFLCNPWIINVLGVKNMAGVSHWPGGRMGTDDDRLPITQGQGGPLAFPSPGCPGFSWLWVTERIRELN